ncbi:MAG TPA: hypothetical protein VEH49_01145 [Methylomirabilota bacterium]|nr:hypothetical protein [Methylomirabilota bacterium]
MSTDAHETGKATGAEPVHRDVAFEPRDFGSGGVLKFLVLLAVTIAVAYLVCLGVYKLTVSEAAHKDSPPPPARQRVRIPPPPEPRLQGVPAHPSDPQADLRAKIAADRRALEQARWVDEKAGVAQIPIEDAMRLIVEKGLPQVSAVTPTGRAEKKEAKP